VSNNRHADNSAMSPQVDISLQQLKHKHIRLIYNCTSADFDSE